MLLDQVVRQLCGRELGAHKAAVSHPIGMPVADRNLADLSPKNKKSRNGSRLFRLYLITL